MKKVLVTLVITLLVTTFSFAQDAKKNATKIGQFTAGATLSKDDVSFLNVVANGPEKKRGAASDVTIDKTKYAVGAKLTKEDADKLNAKAAAYGKAQKEPDTKTRSAVCYYYYCNGYGNCYYVYYYC